MMTNDPVWQWQPIATAPHDENILIFSRRWEPMVATFRCEFNAWFSRMQCPASLNEGETDLVTHWMPLPPVPDLSQHSPTPRAVRATGLPLSLARLIERVSTGEAA
jgi:hypothetical protein